MKNPFIYCLISLFCSIFTVYVMFSIVTTQPVARAFVLEKLMDGYKIDWGQVTVNQSHGLYFYTEDTLDEYLQEQFTKAKTVSASDVKLSLKGKNKPVCSGIYCIDLPDAEGMDLQTFLNQMPYKYIPATSTEERVQF